MDLLQRHRSVFRALSGNLMRTGLTMLGVVVGVSAVICTMAIGDGATAQLRSEIASAGANMIWIEAGSVNRLGFHSGARGTKTLTVDDAKANALLRRFRSRDWILHPTCLSGPRNHGRFSRMALGPPFALRRSLFPQVGARRPARR